jgi:hypothetical protein
MARTLREKIHNPFDWTCNCDPTCWCNTTRWGRALMWYIPPRFHRFPPKECGDVDTLRRRGPSAS